MVDIYLPDVYTFGIRHSRTSMNTAVIITKTDPEVKAKAQAIAKELGLSLSAIMNGWLRQLIRTKKVTFEAESYEPTPRLERVINKAEKDLKEGKHFSPRFKTGEEAVAWLEQQGI